MGRDSDKRRRRARGRSGTKRRTSADTAAGRTELDGDRDVARELARILAHRGGDLDRQTHRFHTYPARLHPDAARDLLALLPGQAVLDPFCGGGTVAVETMLAGRTAFARDLNPVAIMVATARTRLVDDARLERLRRAGDEMARRATSAVRAGGRISLPPAVHKLRGWYGRAPLDELGALRNLIAEAGAPPLETELLRAAHSSLVIKYSHRASDTSNRRQAMHRAPGTVIRAFVARIEELCGMLAALRRDVPDGTPEADVALADARQRGDLRAQLVVTSPPYPATYDYLPLQQLRLAWLGLEPDEDDEIGSRRAFREQPRDALASWRRATNDWIAAMARVLTPDGQLAIVVGDGIAQRRLIDARRGTLEAARRAGFTLRASASIGRRDEGVGATKKEHLFVFAKPGGTSS